MKLKMIKLIVLTQFHYNYSTLLNEHKINAEIIGREKPLFQFGEKFKKKEYH